MSLFNHQIIFRSGLRPLEPRDNYRQLHGDDQFQNGQTIANHIQLFPVFTGRRRHDHWHDFYAAAHCLPYTEGEALAKSRYLLI